MAPYPSFPELSRAPALKTKTSPLDPTLRDPKENGMVATRAKFRRLRRSFTMTLEYLTNDDVRVLDEFVRNVAVYGANPFFFPDTRDASNPVQLLVRFDVIPKYDDAGWVVDQLRQTATFELGEL